MERRGFLGSLVGGLLAAPRAREAQQESKVYRVGLIVAGPQVSEMTGPEAAHPPTRAFVHGLLLAPSTSSSRGPGPPTTRWNNPQSLNSRSTSRLPKRSASPSRSRGCSGLIR